MTCEEFERVLPELEGIEQEAHLRSCPGCSALVSDLNAIAKEARLLQSSAEPSPWVWNSIELALRRDGLIRESKRERALALTPLLGWKLRWLVPLAAVFLVSLGVLMHKHGTAGLHLSQQRPISGDTITADLRPMAGDDQQLLNTVAARMPSMRAAYETNLRSVNAYIRDAEQSAHSDPNDEVAQQYLMNAYEQKAMVYEMALDRSLP
jgi:hypothetical protein